MLQHPPTGQINPQLPTALPFVASHYFCQLKIGLPTAGIKVFIGIWMSLVRNASLPKDTAN
jgi:hypothetical protein